MWTEGLYRGNRVNEVIRGGPNLWTAFYKTGNLDTDTHAEMAM